MNSIANILIVVGAVSLGLVSLDLMDYDYRWAVIITSAVVLAIGTIIELVERGYWK